MSFGDAVTLKNVNRLQYKSVGGKDGYGLYFNPYDSEKLLKTVL